VLGNPSLWQRRQQSKDLSPVPQVPTRELTNHEGMADYLPLVEKLNELRVAPGQMVDPNRGIDEDHQAAERRRRIDRSELSVPPSLARRRALSKAIKASRPRRIKAVFSVIPVNCSALFRRESSILSVVLICISMH